jgi:hypothetical protein
VLIFPRAPSVKRRCRVGVSDTFSRQVQYALQSERSATGLAGRCPDGCRAGGALILRSNEISSSGLVISSIHSP